jgi:hypothetical protein
MNIDEEQKAFEEWALKAGCFPIQRLTRAPRYYQDSHTESAFLGWLGQKEAQAEPNGVPANVRVERRACKRSRG